MTVQVTLKADINPITLRPYIKAVDFSMNTVIICGSADVCRILAKQGANIIKLEIAKEEVSRDFKEYVSTLHALEKEGEEGYLKLLGLAEEYAQSISDEILNRYN